MGSNSSKTNRDKASEDAVQKNEDRGHATTSERTLDSTLGAPSVIFYQNKRIPHAQNLAVQTRKQLPKKADRWYLEDVTTTSHEPRRQRQRDHHQPIHDDSDSFRIRKKNTNLAMFDTKEPDLSTGSQPPLCVNTPQNVALFMEKFESDIRQLLPYCFNLSNEPEFSIALCFVSRLTMQDRSASQRLDCKYFPPFQQSQRAFYFRLIPVGEQSDHLFVVEYYKSPDYKEPSFVFSPHGWIQFEALLRLFFHQGYRYLMKLFPETPSSSSIMETQQQHNVEEEEEECNESETSLHCAFSRSIPNERALNQNGFDGRDDIEQSVW